MTSCPDTTVESIDIALQPFPEPSFLSDSSGNLVGDASGNLVGDASGNLMGAASGNLTKDQFNKLIENEIKAKRLIDMNSYSAYQLSSRLNREYCYYLKRVVFFDKKYAATGDTAMKEKGNSFKEKMDTMLACINYMEDFLISGNGVTPTESRRPSSWNLLGLTENFGLVENFTQRIEMSDSADIALRKDMLSYSEEKNRAATSLLALYGFLNLTAVGLLIYMYRSKTS